MAHRRHLTHLHTGTPTTGIWCNACMTSGGVRVPLLRITDAGVTLVAEAVGCHTCDGPGDLDI